MREPAYRSDWRSSPPAVKFAVCIGVTVRSQADMGINPRWRKHIRDAGGPKSAFVGAFRSARLQTGLQAFGPDEDCDLGRRQKSDKRPRRGGIGGGCGEPGRVNDDVLQFGG